MIFSALPAVNVIFSFNSCIGATRNVIINYNYFNYDSKQTYGKIVKEDGCLLRVLARM